MNQCKISKRESWEKNSIQTFTCKRHRGQRYRCLLRTLIRDSRAKRWWTSKICSQMCSQVMAWETWSLWYSTVLTLRISRWGTVLKIWEPAWVNKWGGVFHISCFRRWVIATNQKRIWCQSQLISISVKLKETYMLFPKNIWKQKKTKRS